jgi:hypothetical protein
VDNGVRIKPESIVQVWMGDASDVERITSMGLRVIFSSCWYLDYIGYGQDWDKYYRCEQISDYLDEYHLQNESLLIGGEACLWSEYAADDSITPRLWPRASAAAERLWSNKKVKDEVAAAPRIEEQRCRMMRRGVRVGVLGGPGHCAEYKKGKKKNKEEEKRWMFWQTKTESFEESRSSPQIYVVDMNALYLVPVLIVICICCLTLLSLTHQDSKNKFVAILTYPVTTSSKKGVRSLLYVFLLFTFIWCVWTAPIWMNTWENKHQAHRVGR